MLQLCIVGINKINILPYLENKNIYSKEVLEEYSDIFNAFTTSKTFFNHGHLLKWQGILDLLPEINTNHICLTDPAIIIGKPNEINPLQKEILESALLSLSPWRKGPFNLFGLEVDSEWRCENKWKRIKDYFLTGSILFLCVPFDLLTNCAGIRALLGYPLQRVLLL